MTSWGAIDLLTLGRQIAPTILLLMGTAFVLVGLVLWYHWRRFALRPARGLVWLFVYFAVGASLLLVMLAASRAL